MWKLAELFFQMLPPIEIRSLTMMTVITRWMRGQYLLMVVAPTVTGGFRDKEGRCPVVGFDGGRQTIVGGRGRDGRVGSGCRRAGIRPGRHV